MVRARLSAFRFGRQHCRSLDGFRPSAQWPLMASCRRSDAHQNSPKPRRRFRLVLRRVSRGGHPAPASVPASTSGASELVTERLKTGMSANEPRRIARRREPMFNAPVVVLGLIAVLIGIYAAFNWAPVAIQDRIIRDYAFIPGRLTIAIWPDRLVDLLSRANTDPAALQQVRQIRELQVLGGGAKPWTLLTYAFLHGSWTHVLLNCVWLVAFGPPIARRFGAARFLLFMAATAIASALAHWVISPMDFSPLIGASGADSGLMGAATRFMFQPGAPLGAFGSIGRPEVESIPAASLGRRLCRAPVAHLHFDLVGDEFHFRRRSSDARLFGHAGRLGRPSRRLFRRARAVSAVRSPVPRPADERRACDRSRRRWRFDRVSRPRLAGPLQIQREAARRSDASGEQ